MRIRECPFRWPFTNRRWASDHLSDVQATPFAIDPFRRRVEAEMAMVTVNRNLARQVGIDDDDSREQASAIQDRVQLYGIVAIGIRPNSLFAPAMNPSHPTQV
jgi:hypothetical protein